jgi:Haem-degrading
MYRLRLLVFAIVIFAGSTLTGRAQQPAAPSAPPTTPYGSPISLDAAKKVMAAAEAEAMKNNWPMAIVILDSTGHPVMLHSSTTRNTVRSALLRTRRRRRSISAGRAKYSKIW